MKSSDAWKQNLIKKAEHISDLLLKYLASRNDELAKSISAKLEGLKTLFSDDLVPQQVTALLYAIKYSQQNAGNPNAFAQLLNAYQAFPSVIRFDEDNPQKSSFDEIFAAYKNDGELQALVDEFISALQRIITEADDELSAHIARELEVILAQIKRQQALSLYELQNWADLGVRTLILYGETHTGTHGANLVWDAAKIGWKILKNLGARYADAQRKLMDQHDLSYVQKAVTRFPQIPSEHDAFQRLRLEANAASSDK